MEIEKLFKDEDKKEKVGVMDLINRIIQVLKRELVQLRNSVQELDKEIRLNLVEPWDKG